MAVSGAAIIDAIGGAAAVETAATYVSYAGVALSVVGVATGNSNLTKIGGIMGIAGGVTALGTTAFSASDAGGAALAANAAQSSTDTLGTVAQSDLSGGATNSLTGSNLDAMGNPVTPSFGSVDNSSLTGGFVSPSSSLDNSLIANPSTSSGTGLVNTVNLPPNGVTSAPTSFPAATSKPWDSTTKADLALVGGSALGGLQQAQIQNRMVGIRQQAQDLAAQQYNTQVIDANAQPTFKSPTVPTASASQSNQLNAINSTPTGSQPANNTNPTTVSSGNTPIMGPGLVSTVNNPSTSIAGGTP